ncbi:MAG: ATP-binding cassette domain-containing protein [Planctomycetia bacterium]|nr:ATP-binding cassette domain-containing protein [Planctomycetia bacterium]
MAQLVLRDVCYALGFPPLLDKVCQTVEEGEKIALIGRNGAGKTTLLRILGQDLQPDSGEITRQQGLRTMVLDQKVPATLHGTVYDIVASGMAHEGERLSRFHEISAKIGDAYAHEDLPLAARLEKELGRLQHELDASGAWESQRKIEYALQQIGIDGDEEIANLSAGKKRRALFGRAMVAEPDVLLLDEPTNHLDLDSVLWLEEFLKKYEKTVLFVTHDRMFLRRIATSIWELDRGDLFRYDCDYDTYLDRREQRLHAEEKEREHFQKKLAQEEVWIRTGIMARRTRNEGRVRALQEMRVQASRIRKDPGTAKMEIHEGVTSGRLVVEAKNLSFGYAAEQPIFERFSTKIMRGDRIGILGPNGVGKTTLIRVLLGQLPQTSGTIRMGTQVQIAYFDQLQATLDEEKSVVDNVSDGTTQMEINGRKQHVLGYLRDFLFSEERAKMPVKFLSGGEKNRILLAKLFAKPSNVLVMDEPTNDLDMETLDLLEDLLLEYPGTLLLVSHDREFLNNVVTSTLVFEGNGVVKEYVGGYDDWVFQKSQKTPEPIPEKKEKKKPEPKPIPAARRLNYMEKKELEKLPERIEQGEAKLAALHAKMSEPGFYQQDTAEIQRVTKEAETAQTELETLYARWEELDAV